MRRPEDIEEEIELLYNELKESKEFYEYELLCDHTPSDDTIGLFDIGRARKILSALYDGEILQLRSPAFGNFMLEMNPQRNRILVSSNVVNPHVTEDNVMGFIVWHYANFFIKKQ